LCIDYERGNNWSETQGQRAVWIANEPSTHYEDNWERQKEVDEAAPLKRSNCLLANLLKLAVPVNVLGPEQRASYLFDYH
jgi:hypothetical protein